MHRFCRITFEGGSVSPHLMSVEGGSFFQKLPLKENPFHIKAIIRLDPLQSLTAAAAAFPDCCSIKIKAPTKFPESKTTENISSWPDPTSEVTALGPLTVREPPHRLWAGNNPEAETRQRRAILLSY